MSETSTTASTFEPDIEKLARAAYHNHFDFPEWPDVTAVEEALWHQTAQVVIAEYQHQAATAGLVMVPERALWTIFDKAREHYHFWMEEDIADRDAIAVVLGIKPEPAPGGDES